MSPPEIRKEEVETMLKYVMEKFRPVIEEGKRALEALRKYREAAEKVKEAARKIAGDAKVYVFGSALTGRYTAASDVDILIVNREEKADLKGRGIQDGGRSRGDPHCYARAVRKTMQLLHRSSLRDLIHPFFKARLQDNTAL
jgi:hypothetical protein